MSEPMTDERLEQIRKLHIDFANVVAYDRAVGALLAEIDRLRAVVAAYEQAEKRERERGEMFGQ